MTKQTKPEADYDGSTPIQGQFAVMQEAFVANILAGIVQYKAYKEAGYSPKQTDNAAMASSSALLRNPKVKARLAYKRAKLAKKADITERKQIERFQNLSEGAEKEKQYSAAVSAEKEVATICGLYAKDNEQRQPRTIIEILARVGSKSNIPCLDRSMGVLEAGNVQEQAKTAPG